MVIIESVLGPQLLLRLPELKALGHFVFRLDVGKRNSEWVIHYYERELVTC